MKNFCKNKKICLIFLIFLICFLTYFFYIFQRTGGGSGNNNGNQKFPTEENPDLVSVVYRYDSVKNEEIFDEGESWQKSDFTRHIYDIALKNATITDCYYIIYDLSTKKSTAEGKRKCNSNFVIGVGEKKYCQFQGENACLIYFYALDIDGKRGKMTALIYNIDWEKPIVGKVFIEENQNYPIKIQKGESKTFKVGVLDNVKTKYCWLYLGDKNVGIMKINPDSCEGKECIASLDYLIEEGENYEVSAVCADNYEPERGEYLNVAHGEKSDVIIVQNHAPEINFCKAIPSSGNTQTDFLFEASASDIDGDGLSFYWDFGDGETSTANTLFHKYKKPGTYESKIVVSDGREQDTCFTPWVVVSGQ